MKSTSHFRLFLLVAWLTMLGEAIVPVPSLYPALAQTAVPPTWDVLADNFESGTLDKWALSSHTGKALLSYIF